MSLSNAAKLSKTFDKVCKFVSAWGLVDVIKGGCHDKIIEDFMNAQETDLFKGCVHDSDAINLGKHLADGALYYNKHKKDKKANGISKSEWGKRIRESSYVFNGNIEFESFDKLMENSNE